MEYSASVDDDYLWEKDHGIFKLGSDSIVFTCFYLDPYIDDGASRVEKIKKELIEYEFQTWIEYYTWSCKLPRIEVRRSQGYSYIFGHLQCGYNLDDKWLITHLLFDFSSRYNDLFVHIFDAEGEFLFIELADSIPDFLDTGCGMNRIWLNSSQAVIIPNDYYPDQNLSLNESLKFLENSSYKLLKDELLNKAMKASLKEYPQKALKNVFSVEAEVTPEVVAILLNNHKAIGGLSLQRSLESEKLAQEALTEELVRITIRLTAFPYMHLADSDLLKNPRRIGLLVQSGLEKLKKSGLSLQEAKTDFNETDLVKFNTDSLQLELKRLQKIPAMVASDSSELLELMRQEDDEEDAMKALEQVFKDSATIENLKEADEDFGYNDESDYSSDSGDERIKKYLAQGEVDIDEDDFFEFFCKNALKLNDEEIETFRSRNFRDDITEQKKRTHKNESELRHTENSDDDYVREAEFDEENLSFTPEMAQMLRSFLKADNEDVLSILNAAAQNHE